MKFADKQNEKIKAISEDTLVIGCDIAKNNHVARAFDFRGIELGTTLFFQNSANGFQSLLQWTRNLQQQHHKAKVVLGVEPTGHYWLSLGEFIQTQPPVRLVMVNPHHTKQSKELDDNSPTKNDAKDAKVIAKLVIAGCYFNSTIPTGEYAELRAAMGQYHYLQNTLAAIKGRIHTWLDRYFPEFTTVFKKVDGKAALATLGHFPLPQTIITLSSQDIIDTWRTQVARTGVKKALALQAAAKQTVGSQRGLQSAREEIKNLLMHYQLIKEQIAHLVDRLETILTELPGGQSMLSIPGVGTLTVAGFLGATGPLHGYTHWRQIVRLAGLNLKENTSGKQMGKTTITKRGRADLRALLFRSVLILVATNKEIKALHRYLTTRKENPLKKMSSMIAICGKLIRLLFALGRNPNRRYEPDKALGEERLRQIHNAA